MKHKTICPRCGGSVIDKNDPTCLQCGATYRNFVQEAANDNHDDRNKAPSLRKAPRLP